MGRNSLTWKSGYVCPFCHTENNLNNFIPISSRVYILTISSLSNCSNYSFSKLKEIMTANNTDFSSIGRVFRSPLRSEEENGGPSASGGHLGWPHFRFPQMRSPKMATGSGRAAIFLLTPQWGSKNAPQVLDDVISGAAILDSRWRWWKWRLEDVETPVKTSYRRLPHPWVL